MNKYQTQENNSMRRLTQMTSRYDNPELMADIYLLVHEIVREELEKQRIELVLSIKNDLENSIRNLFS